MYILNSEAVTGTQTLEGVRILQLRRAGEAKTLEFTLPFEYKLLNLVLVKTCPHSLCINF